MLNLPGRLTPVWRTASQCRAVVRRVARFARGRGIPLAQLAALGEEDAYLCVKETLAPIYARLTLGAPSNLQLVID